MTGMCNPAKEWLDFVQRTRIFRRFPTGAPIAQLVEQLTLNQRVLGSNPSGRTICLYPRSARSEPDAVVGAGAGAHMGCAQGCGVWI